VLNAGFLRDAVEVIGVLRAGGDGFLAIDVFAERDGFLDRRNAAASGLRVEVDDVVGVGQRRVEVGGEPDSLAQRGELLELRLVAANKDRVGMMTSPSPILRPPCLIMARMERM